jgi:hypothetical protein
MSTYFERWLQWLTELLVTLDNHHPIRWLNSNAGFVQGLLTIAVVVLTVVTIRDSRRHSYHALLPVVAFHITPNQAHSFGTVSIRNVGLGPALNVVVHWSASPETLDWLALPMGEEAGAIAPNGTRDFVLEGDMAEINLLDTPGHPESVWQLWVAYCDVHGREGHSAATLRVVRPENHSSNFGLIKIDPVEVRLPTRRSWVRAHPS